MAAKTYQRMFEKHGMQFAVPDEANQAMVMQLIYGDIKQGKRDVYKRQSVSRTSSPMVTYSARAIVSMLRCLDMAGRPPINYAQ